MRSRKVILGVGGIVVLAVAAVVGAVLQRDVLTDIAVTLLVAGVGLLVVDATVAVRRADQQLRRLRGAVRKMTPAAVRDAPRPQETAPRTEPAPEMSAADLIGTIRLLQAQYVGRLDRAHAALDRAVDELSAAKDREG